MKRLFVILAGLLVAGAVFAESPGMITFRAFDVQTNGAATATLSPDPDNAQSGWIDTIILDVISGTGITNIFTLSTLAAGGTGASRTLLTLTDVAADGVYPVRDLAATQAGVDITGESVKIPLVGDKLRLTAQQDGATGTNAVSATMYVIFSNDP